jgi:hypothetical protein
MKRMITVSKMKKQNNILFAGKIHPDTVSSEEELLQKVFQKFGEGRYAMQMEKPNGGFSKGIWSGWINDYDDHLSIRVYLQDGEPKVRLEKVLNLDELERGDDYRTKIGKPGREVKSL